MQERENSLAISRLFPLDDSIIEQFNHVNDLADQIENQNEQLDSQLPTIQDSSLRQDTGRLLAEAQDRTFNELVVNGASLPYENILEKERELEQKIGTLAITEEERVEFCKGIDKDVKIAKGILPDREDDLIMLGEERKRDFNRTTSEEDSRLKAELEQEQRLVDDLWEAVSKPWPIPRMVTENGYKQAFQYLVEYFPQDYSQSYSKQIAERAKSRYKGRLPDASEFLSLILMEEPAISHTPEELGSALYGVDDADRGDKITSLISNFRIGHCSVIGENLEGEGLILQQGIRRRYDSKTEREIGQARAVYRAVPKNEADKKVRIERLLDGTLLRENEWQDVSFSEVETVEDALEEESLLEAVGPTPAPVNGERDRELLPAWAEEFKDEVNQAIQRLDEEGILREKTVPLHLMRTLSGSGIFGSKTMIKRALQMRLISRDDESKELFTASQVVMMKLQNTQKELSKSASRKTRKLARKIVEEQVDNFFERKRREK